MSGATPTVHLVYPHRPRISAPDSIGYQLGQRLEQHYPVKYYDWDEIRVIKPAPGDVLLGHPHPAPWTCFRRSLSQSGWRRRLALFPYSHNEMAVAYADPVLKHCDLCLAITGNYWFRSIDKSAFAHWRPKMVQLDLAVNRRDFPILKTGFSPAGQRRLLYIGHSGWTKNTDYLSELACAMPGVVVDWIGRRIRPVPNVNHLGVQDFSADAGRSIVASHDFFITVSKADANPTTILEAMGWGLIPICTPQSGYVDYPGIINIPVDNVPQAAAVLNQIQFAPQADLLAIQSLNWKLLDMHFTWDRFAQQVIEAIESNSSPPLEPISARHRLQIQRAAFVSPHSPWRPLNVARWVRQLARQLSKSSESYKIRTQG